MITYRKDLFLSNNCSKHLFTMTLFYCMHTIEGMKARNTNSCKMWIQQIFIRRFVKTKVSCNNLSSGLFHVGFQVVKNAYLLMFMHHVTHLNRSIQQSTELHEHNTTERKHNIYIHIYFSVMQKYINILRMDKYIKNGYTNFQSANVSLSTARPVLDNLNFER